jgi:hypothetical protein
MRQWYTYYAARSTLCSDASTVIRANASAHMLMHERHVHICALLAVLLHRWLICTLATSLAKWLLLKSL